MKKPLIPFLAVLLVALIASCQMLRAQSVGGIFFETSYTRTLGTVATPAFSPDGGSVASGATVTITDPTSGSAILYCKATGADCTPGTSYTAPVAITVDGTHLCANATKASYTPSATYCKTFTVVVIPAYSQSAFNAADGTFTATLNTHNAGGMLCAFAIYKGSSAASGTISNTAGYTWTQVLPFTYDSAHTVVNYQAWCAPTTSRGTSDTVTVVPGGSVFQGGVAIVEIANATTVDGNSGFKSPGTYTVPSSGAFTLTGTSDIVLAMEYDNPGQSTATGCTVLKGTYFGSGNGYGSLAYCSISGTTANVTFGTANNPWALWAVGLK